MISLVLPNGAKHLLRFSHHQERFFALLQEATCYPSPSQWVLMLTRWQMLFNRSKLDIIGHAVACERVVPVKDDGISIDIHYSHLDRITAF
jgi:hypothetical protein